MKIVVFGPSKRVGAWVGDAVIDLNMSSGGSLPADLRGLIETGDAGLAQAQAVIDRAGSTPDGKGVFLAADVQLHAPHVPGARVACAGGNFADHMMAMMRRMHGDTTDANDPQAVVARLRERGIWGFWKVGRDAAGPGAEIAYPARTRHFDYEGEAAIVLGKPVKDAKAADLASCVWGITLFGDWSIRDLNEGTAAFKFAAAKNFDGSFSIGPCIVAGEGLDPAAIDVETYVNGERRQHFNTRDMIMKFGEYLEYLSTDFTLYPGDVISGGTAAGTAADSSERVDGVYKPERFLKPGDEVEMRSPQIGSLTARIVAKR